MKTMIREYNLPFIDRMGLDNNNFKFDFKSQLYTLSFPAYRWQKYTTLEGIITVDLDSKDLWVDVRTKKKEPYDAFYGIVYGRYDELINAIHKNINKQFKGMGLKVKYKLDK